MIPDLDHRGLLPPGIHAASLDELTRRFGGNDCRNRLLERFRDFIQAELLPWASGLTLYVGGSLLSDKPCPGDVDCVLVVPIERCSGVAASRMALGASDTHTHLKNQYQVDFYIQIAGFGNDFSAFFQYIGEKTAAIKHLQPHDRRGIVRITL